MKSQIVEHLQLAIDGLKNEGLLEQTFEARINVENTKDKKNGDFATNLAMMLTKVVGKPPREVANLILEALPETDIIEKIEIAGPGFINFFVQEHAKFDVVETVLVEQATFGQSDLGQGQKVLLEYVSANPTGPLHVGHGRGAAYGASVANLLKVAGFEVSREYYVNDAGRQMDILATSVWLRYLSLTGQDVVFPSNGYQG